MRLRITKATVVRVVETIGWAYVPLMPIYLDPHPAVSLTVIDSETGLALDPTTD